MQKLLLKFKIDTLLKYGIAAILIAVPLYPKFPFINVPGIYVSIRIEDFLILVVTVLWFLKTLPNLFSLYKNPVVRAIILFLATGFLATLLGVVFLNTATALVGFLEWARRVEYLLGFFIAFTTLKSIKDLEFYMKCIGIVLAIVFVVGLAQKYFNFPVITTQNSEYSKGIALRYVPGTQLVSTFAGHYDLASYILITSPILLGIFFVVKKNWQKIIVFLLIATSFWLMINAASRITAVAYVLAMSITLVVLRKTKYILIIVVATIVFAFATSNLFDRYLNIFNAIKDRLSDLIIRPVYAQGEVLSAQAPVQDLSTSIRLNVEWPRAIRAFLKDPLLGTGYASATLATDNDYLRALAETGALGAITFFVVFFRITKDLIMKSWPKGILSKKQINFRTAYLAGVIGIIPAVLLNAVFIDIFEASKFAIPFWFLIGFAMAILYNAKNFE
ncbi:MAG TPA: O-antigen ligase family protein [Patescibacteria group bacterium]|nr:O-antigen ligase family protein [Patescibacteria group bacterium]